MCSSIWRAGWFTLSTSSVFATGHSWDRGSIGKPPRKSALPDRLPCRNAENRARPRRPYRFPNAGWSTNFAASSYFSRGFFSAIVPALWPSPPHHPGSIPDTIAPTPYFSNRSSAGRSYSMQTIKSTPPAAMSRICCSVRAYGASKYAPMLSLERSSRINGDHLIPVFGAVGNLPYLPGFCNRCVQIPRYFFQRHSLCLFLPVE